MIFWLVLFIIIVSVSFVLAYLSMRDYQEIPKLSTENGLYLIQAPNALTAKLLENIYSQVEENGYVVSLERLFKGQKSALVIFGPKAVLEKFTGLLKLLELEDYARVDLSKVLIWEVARKEVIPFEVDNLFGNIPDFSSSEQFWWQVILFSKKSGSILDRLTYLLIPGSKKSEPKKFQIQIRAAVVSDSDQRRNDLAATLQKMAEGRLVKIPRPYSNEQLIESFKLRLVVPFDKYNFSLNSVEVIHLIGRS